MKFAFTIGFCLLVGAAVAQVYGSGLVINEFMAVNDSTSVIVDQDGQHEDWIELYNNSNQTLNLEGFYLSDKYDNPTKWSFPAGTTIAPDAYVIVWADEDGSQMGLHANFKLSRDGEQLILSNPFEEVLDSITFGLQEDNVPMARKPNGTGGFVMQAPTFGYNNNLANGLQNLEVMVAINTFPNPTNGRFTVTMTPRSENGIDPYSIRVIAADGRMVKQMPKTTDAVQQIDLTAQSSGLYWLEISTATGRGVYKVVKL